MICSPAIATAREHPYFVTSISMSPDARYIAIGRLDNKIVIFDRENKKVFKVIEDKTHPLNWDTAFTPDSKYLVFQYRDNNLLFYDLEKQEITRKIQLDDNFNAIAFYKDMKKMIWGGNNGKIEVVNLETDERIMLKVPHPEPSDFQAPISSIKLSPDEKYFVTTTYTETFSWEFEPEPEEDYKPIWEGGTLVVKHVGLNLWDAKTFKKIKKMAAEFLSGRTWPTFSPGGKYLVAVSENGVTVWDVNDKRLLFENHHLTNGVGFSSNNYFVGLWSGKKQHLTFYNLVDLVNRVENFKTLNCQYRPCTGGIVTDPDRNLIVVGTRDGSISVYKFNPKKLTIDLEWHPKSVVAGLIRWLSPTVTRFKATDQIDDLMRQYEVNQLRLTDEDRKKGTAEIKYETIQIPEEKEKEQKNPIPTLIPVK